jgi:hypothetical protein
VGDEVWTILCHIGAFLNAVAGTTLPSFYL